METELKECIESGLHLTECDEDGYCIFCGHQEGGDYDRNDELS